MDIAEIKYDAIAELSGSSESSATATKTASDGGGGKPRKEVPRNPQTQPDNVCFYRVSDYYPRSTK